jgi:hypothetical protein
MGIALIIVLGVFAITVVSVIGDVASKKAKAKAAEGGVPPAEIESLKARLASLEARADERDDRVQKLQDEVRFVTRMLEDKSGGRSGN